MIIFLLVQQHFDVLYNAVCPTLHQLFVWFTIATVLNEPTVQCRINLLLRSFRTTHCQARN